MTSHIQLVEDGHLIGLDGRPWSAAAINEWAGPPCELHRHMQRGEVAHRFNPHPLVFLRYRAQGRSRIVSGSRRFDVDVAPAQVDIFPAGFRMDHGWWDCTPGDLVTVELNPTALEALSPYAERPLALRAMLSGCDETLAQLLHCVRIEIESGCPSGKLFADGLAIAIMSRLRAMHDDPEPGTHDDALDIVLRRRIVDYITANVGADLRIASLARIAGLTSSQFVRAFRRAFGTTPHRYVVERRLERARALLATKQSLATIAYTLGFSSQGHFTQAFRRRYGDTPGRSRHLLVRNEGERVSFISTEIEVQIRTPVEKADREPAP
jgi:AraC family transcriptional regulator